MSSLFWIVLAIIAMEAVLYLLLMARKQDTRTSAIAVVMPLVIVGLFLVLNNEWSVDLFIQVAVILAVLGALLGPSTGSSSATGCSPSAWR